METAMNVLCRAACTAAAMLLLPGAVAAQVDVSRAPCGWLGFSYNRISHGDPLAAAALVVRAVVPGSPAQRAGLAVGDSITTINAAPAARAGLRLPLLEPGDTVRVVLRRAGQTRELRMVAAAREGGCPLRAVIFDTDSLRRLMRIYVDSGLAIMDSARLPRLRIERGEGDAIVIRPGAGADTIFRLRLDSLRVRGDSARMRLHDLLIEPLPRLGEPPAIHFRELGGRAVAGAEFSELNPELATYFQGVSEGLLVIRVGEGTPAARAGLLPGDVVTGVAGQPVRTVTALCRAVAEERPTRLDVVRRGQRREVRIDP
jgi:predicted metalloprotease with PDZ domain